MQKTILIEAEKCVGCRICESWCSFVHEGKVSPALSRIHVIKWDETGLDIPITCQQCEDPVCSRVCPVNAITKDKRTGLVSVDEGRCIGCRLCVMACPFGGCSMHPETHKMIKCDHCGGEPMCVKMCPRDAINYVNESQVALRKKRSSASKMTELIEKLAGTGSK